MISEVQPLASIQADILDTLNHVPLGYLAPQAAQSLRNFCFSEGPVICKGSVTVSIIVSAASLASTFSKVNNSFNLKPKIPIPTAKASPTIKKGFRAKFNCFVGRNIRLLLFFGGVYRFNFPRYGIIVIRH